MICAIRFLHYEAINYLLIELKTYNSLLSIQISSSMHSSEHMKRIPAAIAFNSSFRSEHLNHIQVPALPYKVNNVAMHFNSILLRVPSRSLKFHYCESFAVVTILELHEL